MSILVVFAIGYAVGGVSALLLYGLALAGRQNGARRAPGVDQP